MLRRLLLQAFTLFVYFKKLIVMRLLLLVYTLLWWIAKKKFDCKFIWLETQTKDAHFIKWCSLWFNMPCWKPFNMHGPVRQQCENAILKLHSLPTIKELSIVKSLEVSAQYRFWVANLLHFGVRIRLIEVSTVYRFILQ